MVGHGFTSEVAQNKTMAASFDNTHSQHSPKLQPSSHSSSISSSNNQHSNTSDNPLGKKVRDASHLNEKTNSICFYWIYFSR